VLSWNWLTMTDMDFRNVQVALERILSDQLFYNRVEHIVDYRVSDKFPKLIERYMNHTLPGLVSKELLEQVPKFLDQNSVMQNILSNHSKDLTNKLENASRAVLARIANESQYHDVRQAYVRSIDAKFNDQLLEHNEKFNIAMKERLAVVDEMDVRVRNLEYWNKINSTVAVLATCSLAYLCYKK
jgi:hypothetical protein